MSKDKPLWRHIWESPAAWVLMSVSWIYIAGEGEAWTMKTVACLILAWDSAMHALDLAWREWEREAKG